MRTAIFTARSGTKLTIETSEVVDLVQMGQEGPIARLSPGVTPVTVGAGVFKVLSKSLVRVTADAADVKVVATLAGKGGWPDPPVLRSALPSAGDAEAVMRFLADEKSGAAPE